MASAKCVDWILSGCSRSAMVCAIIRILSYALMDKFSLINASSKNYPPLPFELHIPPDDIKQLIPSNILNIYKNLYI